LCNTQALLSANLLKSYFSRIPSDPSAVWLESFVIHPDLRGRGNNITFLHNKLTLGPNFIMPFLKLEMFYNTGTKVIINVSCNKAEPFCENY
jgi:hypothetical protein